MDGGRIGTASCSPPAQQANLGLSGRWKALTVQKRCKSLLAVLYEEKVEGHAQYCTEQEGFEEHRRYCM